MKQPVLALGRNDRLSMAEDLLQQERIRHIPVLDEDGKLCGIVTQRDLFRGALLRALGYGSRLADKLFESLPVKEAMTDEVISTSPETPVSDAARLLLEHKIGCLPVTDNGKLVGIVTETDFIELAT
jgi:CBS domain-containing protein